MNDKQQKRSRSFLGKVGLTLFITLTLFLVAFCIHFLLIRRSTAPQLIKLQDVRNNLQRIAKQADDDREGISRNEQTVLSLLNQCRSAEDIPDFQGERIVAHHQGAETLRFYVPKGTHVLDIETSWGASRFAKPAKDSDSESRVPPVVGEKKWKVPLQPSSGYWFELKSRNKGGPVYWELTSNNAEFEPQNGAIPIGDFARSGASWSGSGVVRLPNQVDGPLFMGSGPQPPGPIMEGRLFGRIEDQPHDIKFKVSVTSDGPIHTFNASSAHQGLLDRKPRYLGGGAYELYPQKSPTRTD